MKKKLKDFSEGELEKAFGDLSDEDLNELLSREGESEWDAQFEAGVSNTLHEIASDVSAAESETISEVPSSIRMLIEETKENAIRKVAEEEAARIHEVSTEGYRESANDPGETWFSSLARSFWSHKFAGATAALAVVAIAFVVYDQFLRPPEFPETINITQTSVNSGGFKTRGLTNPSKKVNFLSPGSSTGFSDPVFIWSESTTSEKVSLDVVDVASGRVVATKSSVESPVQFSALGGDALLSQGTIFKVRLYEGDSVLSERTFKTMPRAVQRGPRREATLEGVIRQCEGFIASGRPADAWMLWTQLSEDEKQDPRMQDLKKIILEKIS